MSMSQARAMGVESSIGKDERKNRLRVYINQGEVMTLQSATNKMQLSESTIISYLKDLKLQLWDAKKDKFVGEPNGQRVGIDIQPLS